MVVVVVWSLSLRLEFMLKHIIFFLVTCLYNLYEVRKIFGFEQTSLFVSKTK